MIDLQPTKCNLCGGDVIFTSNAKVYGRTYGSGKCYLCTNCGAYVGTHGPRPMEALGLLADKEMGIPVKECHFGHMDLQQLEWAYRVIKRWEAGHEKTKAG